MIINHLSIFHELNNQQKCLFAKNLICFPLLQMAGSSSLYVVNLQKRLEKSGQFAMSEKFDSCDRFHIVAKVLIHHRQWSAANFCQPICHILATSLTQIKFLQGSCVRLGWKTVSERLSLSIAICVEQRDEHVCCVWFGPRVAGDAGEDWHLQTAGGEDLWSWGLLVSVCGLEHYRNPEEPKGICAHRLWVQLCYLIWQTFWPNATL